MSLKEEMEAKRREAEVQTQTARDIAEVQGQANFAAAAGQQIMGQGNEHATLGYNYDKVAQTYKPWSKDDDAQLIVYMRSAENMDDLMVHYKDREEHEVWGRLNFLISRRKEFDLLKKALK